MKSEKVRLRRGWGGVRNRYSYAGDQPAKFAVLPYEHGGISCADGAVCGIGILTQEINDLPYKRE